MLEMSRRVTEMFNEEVKFQETVRTEHTKALIKAIANSAGARIA